MDVSFCSPCSVCLLRLRDSGNWGLVSSFTAFPLNFTSAWRTYEWLTMMRCWLRESADFTCIIKVSTFVRVSRLPQISSLASVLS